MSSKPTIIWVPGAWHVPYHYKPVTSLLSNSGYKVVTVRTTSVRQTPPYPEDWTMDAGAVASAILNELDEDKEVVVVMHSYAGVPGSAAVQGLSRQDREKKGLKGGVVRLVYLAAMMFEVGFSGLNRLELIETLPKPREQIEILVDEENDVIAIKNPIPIFYTHASADDAAHAVEKQQPWGLRTNMKPQVYAPWKDISSAYIICEDDQIIYPEEQEFYCNQSGNKVTKYSLGIVDHSPFLTHPKETAAIIEKAIKGDSS